MPFVGDHWVACSVPSMCLVTSRLNSTTCSLVLVVPSGFSIIIFLVGFLVSVVLVGATICNWYLLVIKSAKILPSFSAWIFSLYGSYELAGDKRNVILTILLSVSCWVSQSWLNSPISFLTLSALVTWLKYWCKSSNLVKMKFNPCWPICLELSSALT